MANKGNLWGMKCPECGSEGPFIIDCSITMLVTDTDMSTIGNDEPEFDGSSYCRCRNCDHDGDVHEFYGK